MKKVFIIICLFCFLTITKETAAQCSICTKTAQQLGYKPAQGLNSGIIYLMLAPLAIIAFVSYRWWRGDITDDSSIDHQ